MQPQPLPFPLLVSHPLDVFWITMTVAVSKFIYHPGTTAHVSSNSKHTDNFGCHRIWVKKWPRKRSEGHFDFTFARSVLGNGPNERAKSILAPFFNSISKFEDPNCPTTRWAESVWGAKKGQCFLNDIDHEIEKLKVKLKYKNIQKYRLSVYTKMTTHARFIAACVSGDFDEYKDVYFEIKKAKDCPWLFLPISCLNILS